MATDYHHIQNWLQKRKSSLEAKRVPYEALWKEIRKVYEPALGHSLKGDIESSDDAALRDDEKIYNSKPRNLLHRMAAGLQSGITNQARQWFRFQPQDQLKKKRAAVRKYLDNATEIIQAAMNRSNIYPALDGIYTRLAAFGTAAALLVPDEDTDVRLIVCDEGSYWISDNRKGRIDTLMRRLRMPYSQLVSEFGERALPREILDAIKGGRHEETATVYNLVYPTEQGPKITDVLDGRIYTSIYWLDGVSSTSTQYANTGILAIRSFDYNPIIAPRWSVFGATAYGAGPGQFGLGDALELQKLELDSLEIVEQEANPPMAAPASMRGMPLDTGPGGVVYYPDIQGGHIPVQRLFGTQQNLQAVQLKIQEVEARLSQTFYTDLFAMMLNLNMAPKTMTAREVSELSSEKVALLGPILTRLNSDLLDPLVDGVWNIVYNTALEKAAHGEEDVSGLLDAPEDLIGEDLLIEYVSSLHIEQQASSRLTGLYRLMEFTSALAQVDPQVLDKLDTDEMISIAGRSLVEHGVVRDDKDVETIRNARAQAQQQQMMAQQQALEAKTVKDLAGAKMTDGETALDLVASQGGFA